MTKKQKASDDENKKKKSRTMHWHGFVTQIKKNCLDDQYSDSHIASNAVYRISALLDDVVERLVPDTYEAAALKKSKTIKHGQVRAATGLLVSGPLLKEAQKYAHDATRKFKNQPVDD